MNNTVHINAVHPFPIVIRRFPHVGRGRSNPSIVEQQMADTIRIKHLVSQCIKRIRAGHIGNDTEHFTTARKLR